MMNLQQTTRRHFFNQCSMARLALSLLGRDSARANGEPVLPASRISRPRPKRIYLFMGGGPSQLELYIKAGIIAAWGRHSG